MLQALILNVPACSGHETATTNGRPLSQERSRSSLSVKIGQIVHECADCPTMIVVPQVGRTAENPGKVFYAGRFEVKWREYLAAVREGACPIPEKDFGGLYDTSDPKINDDYPITGISPDVFSCYLKWLKNKTGNVYRMPSSAEWEHIARAGTDTEYYWGNNLGFDNAMVFGYFNKTALEERIGDTKGSFRNDARGDVKRKAIYPVGKFRPNPWGLYDVIGNAAEITTEPYPPLPACLKHRPLRDCEVISARGNDIFRSPNPIGPNSPITASLLTTRYRTTAHYGSHSVGFRLVHD